MKRLNDGAIQKIDASSSSFWAAKNSADKETTGLGLMDRQRVKTWLSARRISTARCGGCLIEGRAGAGPGGSDQRIRVRNGVRGIAARISGGMDDYARRTW